jgi:hypothetical protein
MRTSVFVGIVAHTVESTTACAGREGSDLIHGSAVGASGASAWARAVAEGSGIGADDDVGGDATLVDGAADVAPATGLAPSTTAPPHARATNGASDNGANRARRVIP